MCSIGVQLELIILVKFYQFWPNFIKFVELGFDLGCLDNVVILILSHGVDD
jgi:hypothetical protein